uniref:Uncharacterized protein n=1 Tax=Anguilla anguilla TaxID=7936 RepID=A0A0E9PBR2_ANGAN
MITILHLSSAKCRGCVRSPRGGMSGVSNELPPEMYYEYVFNTYTTIYVTEGVFCSDGIQLTSQLSWKEPKCQLCIIL